MLKLPETLPRLDEPNFILANPVWMQLGIVGGVLLLAPLAGLIWVGSLHLAGQAASAHYAAAGVMALLLAGGVLPRNWRRWVVFAADSRGIFLPTYKGVFHHVPWRDVGPARIDIAGIGSNRQRTVILQLKVDDDTWAALLGGRRRRVNAPADRQGFRPFGIGNAAQNVEDSLRRIEALRRS
jgi:hypothetical protein